MKLPLRPTMNRTQRCLLASGCSTYRQVRLRAPRVANPTGHSTSPPSRRTLMNSPGQDPHGNGHGWLLRGSSNPQLLKGFGAGGGSRPRRKAPVEALAAGWMVGGGQEPPGGFDEGSRATRASNPEVGTWCRRWDYGRPAGVVTPPHQPVAISHPPSLSETPMATATMAAEGEFEPTVVEGVWCRRWDSNPHEVALGGF
jgi:hypothetical protein